MAICRDCKKDVYSNYQTIITKRKTEVVICDDCMKKYRRNNVSGARDSK